MAFSTSRAMSILPSCFRCVARVWSPEEKNEKRSRPVRRAAAADDGNAEHHGELLPSEAAAADDEKQHDGNVELLPSEGEKTERVDEQKGPFAEAMEPTGAGEDPLWNDGGGGGNAGSYKRFELEVLSVEQKRAMAQMLRAWSEPAPAMRSSGDSWKPGSLQRRVRYGPESDAAFLKAVIAAGKTGDGDSGEWAKMEEIRLRRQRYLRDYCPFQREEEEQHGDDDEEEETKEAPDDAAEVERTEPAVKVSQQCDGRRLTRMPGGRRERLLSRVDGELWQCDFRRLNRMLGGRDRLPSLGGEVPQ